MSASERFENYEVLRKDDGSIYELGRGAMGVTYKARDTDLHCDVALKVISPGIIGGPDARERFLREARAAAQLRHTNIASVFRLGKTVDETHFYAMEFCEGPTLEQAVAQSGPFPARKAVDIALQVSKALILAEQHRLVHRDLKPSNLILTESRDEGTVVKVIDFGLAKSFADGMQTLATMSTGGFVGTANFASPEQLEERELDIRSDIYSLGVCLWFMLAGRPPFAGSMARVMSQTLSAEPPWNDLAEQPTAVVHLLRRMLAKDPDDRPIGAAALRAELEACLRVIDLPESETEFPIVTASAPTTPAEFEARYPMLECAGRDALGRIFRGTDATHGGTPVAVRVIDPSLTVVPALRRELEAQVAIARTYPHKHLLGPLDFTVSGEGFLVTTVWTNGFTLLDLLRQRGALTPAEALRLLIPLAAAADHAARHGIRGLNFSKEQIVIHFPKAFAPAENSRLLATPLDEWPEYVVKAGTLSLCDTGLVGEAMRASMATIIPAVGTCGTLLAAVPSVAQVACELLGGRSGDAFAPLPRLSEAGNAVLRRAFTDACSFPSATAFIGALQTTIGSVPTSSAPRTATTAPSQKQSTSRSPWQTRAATAFIVLALACAGSGYYFGIHQPREADRKRRSASTDVAEQLPNAAQLALPQQSQQRSEKVSEHPTVDPRIAESFDKLNGMLENGDLTNASAMILGLKQMRMNPTEEQRFDKLRLSFKEQAEGAHLELAGSVLPTDAEIRVDGVLATNEFPLVLKGFGDHTVRFSREGYESFETRRQVTKSNGAESLGIVRLTSRVPQPKDVVLPTVPPIQAPAQGNAEKKQALAKELDRFLGRWIGVYAQNDMNAYVALYDESVDYEYIKGRQASRREVLEDIRKNVNRWPIRNYTVRDGRFVWTDQSDHITMTFIMDYGYSDVRGKRAAGSTNVDLNIRRSGDEWVIIRFRETVNRTRNDKKGE